VINDNYFCRLATITFAGFCGRPDGASKEPELVPLLDADTDGVLEATTLLATLEERHPRRFGLGQVRTLQRRLHNWRAVHGPAKEVYFEQVAAPGHQASIDFTHASDLGVTVAGQPFRHLLFVFALAFSGWTWVKLAFGETFEALAEGLQGDLVERFNSCSAGPPAR
jgi:hypothetical protein